MTGSDKDDAGPDQRADGEPTAPPPESAKPGAEKLVLRAAPRRVVRFRRSVIIGGAACASLAIAGVAWMALGPRTLQVVASGDGKAVAERRTPADAVANLPGTYGELSSDVPVLGDPLPGDLGRTILEHQRGLGIAPATDPNAMPPAMTVEEQAAEAERQQIAAQAAQAREAGVIVQSSGQGAAAPVAGADGATASGGASGQTEQAGRIALDPERDQNNQQRKLDFVESQAAGGITNAHALQTPASPYQLMAGSVIAASLMTGLNSDLPGMVVAQVTEPVFDTVTGHTASGVPC